MSIQQSLKVSARRMHASIRVDTGDLCRGALNWQAALGETTGQGTNYTELRLVAAKSPVDTPASGSTR